jgi:ATP-dependent RNA helicase DOB1
MKDELKKMKRILRRLEYISDKNVLLLKGRFCCEITTGEHTVFIYILYICNYI